jgi:hypothetical protein
MNTEQLWWGYFHTNGHTQVKRYFDRRDLEDARESPFVKDYFGPFEAKDRNDVLCIMEGFKIF